MKFTASAIDKSSALRIAGDAAPMRVQRPMGKWATGLFSLVLTLSLSGCVSSSLESVENDASTATKTTSNTSELALADDQSEEARAQAIAEIRAKADGAAINEEAPDIVSDRRTTTRPLSEEEARAKTAQLATINNQSQSQINDAELAAKKRTMAELRRKAGNHYSQAVDNIQKTE